jgi:putative transposase
VPTSDWSLALTEDCLASDHSFRAANLKGDCTRECPAILVDLSLSGQRLVGTLDGLTRERGYPDLLVVDNGPARRGQDLDQGARARG